MQKILATVILCYNYVIVNHRNIYHHLSVAILHCHSNMYFVYVTMTFRGFSQGIIMLHSHRINDCVPHMRIVNDLC